MDYEQKYKEALKWMQGLYSGLHGATKEEAEKYFPELKESEDERIRKTLVAFFKDWNKTRSHCWSVPCVNIIAWLEKQGKSKPIDISVIGNNQIQDILDELGMIDENGNCPCTAEEIFREGMMYELEKQDKQKDKVEPKFFKVGDWITDGDRTRKVTEFLLSVDFDDANYHLWTINDVKDGDVLIADDTVFIYRKHDGSYMYYHCGINAINEFIVSSSDGDIWSLNSNIAPATQEQRDLLFSKMKEAGYDWDVEKKELKKIEAPKQLNADEVIKAWCKHIHAPLFW